MKTKATALPTSASTLEETLQKVEPIFTRARTVRYVGPVTRATTERVLLQIEKLLNKSPEEEITLFVSSTGGPTGTVMSFFDTIKNILHPRLVTIGSGDVDSSGVILFLTGEKRYITARTTLLLHSAGRRFDSDARFTVREVQAMLAEDSLKDKQYASVVAGASGGKLKIEEVLTLMEAHTVLSPNDLVTYGLAHGILE
jgi:ATP-dependent protease ClpP protease subunit